MPPLDPTSPIMRRRDQHSLTMVALAVMHGRGHCALAQASLRLLVGRPYPGCRRQAKRLANMGERTRPKIRKINQRLVRHLAHLSNGLHAGSKQRDFDADRKPDLMNGRVIRQLWRWFKLAHYPLPSTIPPIVLAARKRAWRIGPATGDTERKPCGRWMRKPLGFARGTSRRFKPATSFLEGHRPRRPRFVADPGKAVAKFVRSMISGMARAYYAFNLGRAMRRPHQDR
jgi:hypothetical protein